MLTTILSCFRQVNSLTYNTLRPAITWQHYSAIVARKNEWQVFNEWNYKNRERDVRFIISHKKIWKIWTLNTLVIKLQIKIWDDQFEYKLIFATRYISLFIEFRDLNALINFFRIFELRILIRFFLSINRIHLNYSWLQYRRRRIRKCGTRHDLRLSQPPLFITV